MGASSVENKRQTEPVGRPFCPKCGSVDIRESLRHRTLDSLMAVFSLRPRRCRTCRKRFFVRDLREAAAEPSNVVRAERIELINREGKAVAVLEVEYSETLPAGVPRLTFADSGELVKQGRKFAVAPGEKLTLQEAARVRGGWVFGEGR